jgi:hypothetical protein
MDDILSDLDFLYNYFMNELRKNGLITSTDIPKECDINEWLNKLSEDQFEKIYYLICDTLKLYGKKYRNTIKILQIKLVLSILLIIVIDISILLIIGIYIIPKLSDYVYIKDQIPFIQKSITIITTLSIIGYLGYFIGIMIYKNIRTIYEKSTSIKKLNGKLDLFSTRADNEEENSYRDGKKDMCISYDNKIKTEGKLSIRIKNFMDSYKVEVYDTKYKDYNDIILVNEINDYFVEKEDIVYKTSNNQIEVNNDQITTEFVSVIFDKESIKTEIVQINEIGNIENSNTDLVDEFIDNLMLYTINTKTLIENNIFIFLKIKLKYLIKYYDLSVEQILKEVLVKINSLELSNPDTVYDNYTKLILLLYFEIEADEKQNNYYNKTLPSKFVKNSIFITYINNLSNTQINNLIDLTDKAITNLDSLITESSNFDDKIKSQKKNNYIKISILTIVIFLILLKIIEITLPFYNINDTGNKDFNWDNISNFLIFFSVWIFTSTIIIVNWYKKIKTFILDKGEYKVNTDLLYAKLQELRNKLDDYKNLLSFETKSSASILTFINNNYSSYTDESGSNKITYNDGTIKNITTNSDGSITTTITNIDGTINKTITYTDGTIKTTITNSDGSTQESSCSIENYSTTNIDNFLDKYDYTYTIDTEDSNNFTKITNNEELNKLWTLDDIKNELIVKIYYDIADIMISYDNKNYINGTKSNKISYPSTEIIINGVLICVCVIVIILILEKLKPLNLLKDYNGCTDIDCLNKYEKSDYFDKGKIFLTISVIYISLYLSSKIITGL